MCNFRKKKEPKTPQSIPTCRLWLNNGTCGLLLDAMNSINLHANMDQYWIDWKSTEIHSQGHRSPSIQPTAPQWPDGPSPRPWAVRARSVRCRPGQVSTEPGLRDFEMVVANLIWQFPNKVIVGISNPCRWFEADYILLLTWVVPTQWWVQLDVALQMNVAFPRSPAHWKG